MNSSRQEETQIQLLEALSRLENLNPDLKGIEADQLMTLARQVTPEAFASVADFTSRLIEQYLHSPIKLAGADIMKEYFSQLEQSARQLRASGDISAPLLTASTAFSTALVPREQNEALDFCKVLNRSVIPKPLVKAADAFRRRNQVVESVFSYAFRVMWTIDSEAMSRWCVCYFQEHEGDLDPDIVRDALSSALACGAVPGQDFVEWTLHFASDPNLLEYWPLVTRYADRFLCRSALRIWAQRKTPRNSLLNQLVRHVRNHRLDDESLLTWCRTALDEVGASVQRFIDLEHSQVDASWRSASLMTELHRIANAYLPVMLVLDQLLVLPDGTSLLAMAFLGLAGESLEKWEEDLVRFSERAVRRTFLLKLKHSESPVDTLRLLTFGDQKAFNTAYAMLDLVTEKFDSISQREKAVAFLSIYYSSYRRPHLLAIEIGRRYRNLMKMLHEDFLRNALDEKQFSEIEETGILQEIATIAAEARKYLGKRRMADNSLEEMMAAKISFERFVREHRASIIRNLMKENTPPRGPHA